MILKVLNPLKHRKCQERPTSPCRLKLPTSPCRLKLQKATSGKPGGYVGQAGNGKKVRRLRASSLKAPQPATRVQFGLGAVLPTLPPATLRVAMRAGQYSIALGWLRFCGQVSGSFFVPKGLDEGSQAIYCLGCEKKGDRPGGTV
jgi:hypothetical protein